MVYTNIFLTIHYLSSTWGWTLLTNSHNALHHGKRAGRLSVW